jgi:hypothetical protein
VSAWSLPSRAVRGLRSLRAAAHPLYAEHFCRVSLVEGTPAHGGPTMRTLFLGSTEFNRYFQARIYASPARVVHRSRRWIPHAIAALARGTPGYDLAVADLPLRYQRRLEGWADWRTSPMVFQHVDLASDWAARRSAPRDARRLVRKHGFSWSVSRLPEDLRFFDERMYRPHALAQFGALASLTPPRALEALFAHGFLLFVEVEGRRVVASLAQVEGRTLTTHKRGVLDGDRQWVARGAVAALYLFLIEQARQRGCDRLGLVSARPLLDDPVFRFKRQWGATVREDERPASLVHLAFRSPSPGFAPSFLQRHPLIVRAPEGLVGLVGDPSAEPLDAARGEALRSRYYSPGLAGLVLVTAGRPGWVGF